MEIIPKICSKLSTFAIVNIFLNHPLLSTTTINHSLLLSTIIISLSCKGSSIKIETRECREVDKKCIKCIEENNATVRVRVSASADLRETPSVRVKHWVLGLYWG